MVDLDPELKARLHARLRREGLDFKSWLLERAHEYLGTSRGSEEPTSELEKREKLGELEKREKLGELERRVLDAVPSDPRARRHVDELAHATGIDVREIQRVLVELELEGHVVQHFGFIGAPDNLWEACARFLALTSPRERSMVHACSGCRRLRVTRRWRSRARWE